MVIPSKQCSKKEIGNCAPIYWWQREKNTADDCRLSPPCSTLRKTSPTQADRAQLHFALARRALAVILTKFISEAPMLYARRDKADAVTKPDHWMLRSLHLRRGLDPLVSHALIFPTLVQISTIHASTNVRYVTFKVKKEIAIFSKYDILTQLFCIPNVVPTAP